MSNTFIGMTSFLRCCRVGLLWNLHCFQVLVIEVSAIDCGLGWTVRECHVWQKTAIQDSWHLMKWPFVCVCVCVRARVMVNVRVRILMAGKWHLMRVQRLRIYFLIPLFLFPWLYICQSWSDYLCDPFVSEKKHKMGFHGLNSLVARDCCCCKLRWVRAMKALRPVTE